MKSLKNLTATDRPSARRKRRAGFRPAPYSPRTVLIILFFSTVAAAGVIGLTTAGRPGPRTALVELYESVLEWLNPPQPARRIVLSKEYVYADSRLLAVEDAGAVNGRPADLALWRPSSGTWWVMNGASAAVTSQNWGAEGDIPAQGDFDGDGKTDFGVFRQSASTWWVLRSGDGSFIAVPFGAAGDVPAPADFDGDGRSDLAVYRPSGGSWFILSSKTGTVSVESLGGAGDVPAPADFDGDGKADISVWRPSAREFVWLNSSNRSLGARSMPADSIEPVPADYDGDGRADPAARSAAGWHILGTLEGAIQTVPWQRMEDIAVQNDYDGDGRVDIAVWNGATGTWHIRNSSDQSTRTVQWGEPGDIPVPAFYRR